MYKITRHKAQALQLPAPAQAAATLAAQRASAGPGAADAAGLVESGDDFGQLRATLLEMLRMPDAECKRAARRHSKNAGEPDAPQALARATRARRQAAARARRRLQTRQARAHPTQ